MELLGAKNNFLRGVSGLVKKPLDCTVLIRPHSEFNVIFCFVVAICDLVHDVRGYTWPMLAARCNFQFHGHHSYFRKYFQKLFAVKEGEI